METMRRGVAAAVTRAGPTRASLSLSSFLFFASTPLTTSPTLSLVASDTLVIVLLWARGESERALCELLRIGDRTFFSVWSWRYGILYSAGEIFILRGFIRGRDLKLAEEAFGQRTKRFAEAVNAMGKGTTTDLCFEIAPPQMITVERASPRQKSMETILERVAVWFETAPPQFISVGKTSSRQKTLDTIMEESINMAVDLVSDAAGALRPLSLNWESTQNTNTLPSKIAPGFVACN